MINHKVEVQQLRDGIDEMGAAVERLHEEIQRLKEQRDALMEGNLTLYRQLTQADF